MTDFSKAIAAAAEASPMAHQVPVLRRILLVDGDGLAYYCAGNEDTTPGEARARLMTKISTAQRACGAQYVCVLLTASGSHKGHRYAIARRKPYQGQRTNAQRPANWQHLREYMSSPKFPVPVQSTHVAEADDLFASWAYHRPHDVVIYTQDKDMRMLPGRHLDWLTGRMATVGWAWNAQPGYCKAVESPEFLGKQYGPKWFWMQMLHGDSADNIPGLPKATIKYGGGPIDLEQKLNPVGEKAAVKILEAHADMRPAEVVALAYQSYYKERWLVEMLEQACLLWLRSIPSEWDDCCQPLGPLHQFTTCPEFPAAYEEIKGRARDADTINATAAEGQRDSGSAGGPC